MIGDSKNRLYTEENLLDMYQYGLLDYPADKFTMRLKELNELIMSEQDWRDVDVCLRESESPSDTSPEVERLVEWLKQTDIERNEYFRLLCDINQAYHEATHKFQNPDLTTKRIELQKFLAALKPYIK